MSESYKQEAPEHTPGNWYADGEVVRTDEHIVCVVAGWAASPKTSLADAALIASAPGLLVRCKKVEADYKKMLEALETESKGLLEFRSIQNETQAWKHTVIDERGKLLARIYGDNAAATARSFAAVPKLAAALWEAVHTLENPEAAQAERIQTAKVARSALAIAEAKP